MQTERTDMNPAASPDASCFLADASCCVGGEDANISVGQSASRTSAAVPHRRPAGT